MSHLKKRAFGDDTAAAAEFERKCLLEACPQVVDIKPATADERAHGEIERSPSESGSNSLTQP
jgi:hypothetical protein